MTTEQLNGASGGGPVIVFSGGSAANTLVDVFNTVISNKGCPLCYIIPISDNGGSTSELIRVLGGPGIGDVRSRLVRLIPEEDTDPSSRAIKNLFNHRLDADAKLARSEWLDLVEARHPLWDHVSSAKKELIRSFLNHINMEIVKRARPSSVFNFANASVGNLFLTGARLFSGSFEASIYLLSSICNIPKSTSVLPAINTNFSHHIRAGLTDGSYITGQNSISHPSDPTALPSVSETQTPTQSGKSTPSHLPTPAHRPAIGAHRTSTEILDDHVEDANLPGSLPVLRKPYITFNKDAGAHSTSSGGGNSDSQTNGAGKHDLPAPIDRIWYINPYGQEIRPTANPAIVRAVAAAQTIVYSIGSLYTSIVPNLILRGVGAAIRGSQCQKVLILNGTVDRETSGGCAKDGRRCDYGGMDFVRAITRAGLQSEGGEGPEVETWELRRYVTHVVYVEGEGAPVVDKREFARVGIETVRVYGRKMDPARGRGWVYDEKGLAQALQAVVGTRSCARVDRSRRNTLET